MENRGQKRMEVVEELPADKRACNSQDFRPSTSGSSVQAQDNGATSPGHDQVDADMDTSSSASPSSRSDEEEQDKESDEEEQDKEDSDYGSCDSDEEEDSRHRVLEEYQRGRSSDDQGKLKSLLSTLSGETDPSGQLSGLTELCEVLSFCTEESLSDTMADKLSPVLVNLAKHENNADIMLLAIRAITYLCDVYPPSVALLVRHETIPALCQRLLTIEYLDVAEQCLQALEKISRDQPVACLNAGAIMAVLSFIDFFSTSIQRVAISTVVNICRKLPSESPSPFMDAVPILCNILQYEDRQLVENVAICLTKIADQVSESPAMLDQLCRHGLIHQSTHLLNLNSRTTLSQPVYNGVIGLLRKLSSGSTLAFRTLYELNIGYRLKEIMSTYDISHSVSSTHVINACSSNQVHEVLKLVIELLPASSVEDNQLALEKESFLVNQPDLLQQFGTDMVPVMIQVLNSGATVYVSYGCLSAIHKLTCLSKSGDLVKLLKNANISSVLAGILSRKDHHVVVVALQLAEVLLEKYSDTFLNSFIKEGVFFAIEALLNSDRAQQNPVSGFIQGSSDLSQKPATKEIVKCLCQSFGKSLSSSLQTCKIDTDTVNILATRIKESFFGPEVFNSEKGLTDVLQDLKVLSEALSALMTVPIDAHVLHDEKFFSIWNQIRERLNGRESVSTFEFTESGVVKSLADYLSNGLYQRKLSKGDPECDTLPFVGKRFEVFTRLLWSDGEATPSVLIEKLQNSLSSLENFPIVLSQFLKQRNSFAAIPNGRCTTYPCLRVRFQKAEGETTLRDYSQDFVTVDPLCYFDAVNQYMWPKVNLEPVESVEAKDQAIECQSSQLQSTSISCQGESSSPMEIDSAPSDAPQFQGSQVEDQMQLPVLSSGSEQQKASSSEKEDALPRLLFRLEGLELDRSLTVYQAILLHKLKSESETTNGSKLSGPHYITYERAAQLGDSSKNLVPPESIEDDEYRSFLSYLFYHRLALRLKGSSPPAYDILFLLKSLEGMNRYLFHLISLGRITAFGEGRLENLDDLMVLVRPVAHSEFVSSKLTEKLEQQLRDSFAVSTCGLPPWFNDLMDSCPFLFSFEVKSKYFRLAAFGSQKIHHHPQHLSNSNGEGRPVTGSLPRKKFLACREKILESAAKMMELYGNQKVVIEVEYSEEVGTGLGPTLEFYTLVSRAFQNPELGMWRSDCSSLVGKPSEHSGVLASPSGLFPRPWSGTSAASSDVLQKFVLLGTVVAKALQDGRVLDLPFSKAFYKLILGQELSSFDIHFVDPALCKTLVELQALARRRKVFAEAQGNSRAAKCDLSFHGTKIEDLCLEFALPGYTDYDLAPHSDNDMVNLDNLEEYIKAIVNATVYSGIQKQVEAFRSGFNQVFPIEHLRIFDEEELETMLCGERDLFNMNEVLDHIKFDHGYTSSSPPVENLLEILHEFDKEQQRAFLQFVTGSPRLPHGGLASLNPKLTIVRKHGSDSSETDLPSVMTCANYLKLPPYSSKEKMKEKLMYAITEGQGSFHLS
ncbi:PREDICTED: E3 ubiquitin-protein ligase UPL4 isoform X1 [Camelina sativa]|uniref:HECT-type E3 ubiquitin transferase n=1 Tax=Camelina sativa TaxID=90675 RepID=A0ABM0TBN8_CAMSA|nr:PREDICTED: E3 ubiquitin-protein ligase UPL4 isoform X1 [Camelina sativa]XP_019084566.1 PREDICTED: E3 ubiquitin-protein ligase UPL4 isoform X1 [Camelina sativa]